MTSVFSWQNTVSLCPASFCTHKFACYSTYFLTFYFFISVPYSEKDIFLGCQFQKVLQVFIEPFTFSFFSIIGWDVDLDYCDIEWFALIIIIIFFLQWILPWKQTEIILSLHSSCTFLTLVDYDGYFISSKGFLPTVVDIMVI